MTERLGVTEVGRERGEKRRRERGREREKKRGN